MLDAVTMGEMMIQLNPLTTGPIRHVNYFEKHAAGTEGNFAIGLTRMGLASGFITRVGNDEFGKYILGVLRSEGVEVSRVIIDREAPTGLCFIQRGYPIPEKSSVIYYRKGSAASRLSPDDIDPKYIAEAKLFHVTGVTSALSESCREATYKALQIAEANNVKISIDTNIRLKLWSADKARETLLPMIRKADIILTDSEDSEILVEERNPRKIARNLLAMGASIVVVKLGEQGALAATKDKTVRKSAFKVPVEDVIGAGDAFAAGFIASILKEEDIDKALEIANVAGALVVTVRGDIENMPSRDEVERFLAAKRKEKAGYR